MFALPLLLSALAALVQAAAPAAPPAIDDVLAEWSTTTPGCSVGVELDGTTVLEKGFGMADLERGVANDGRTIFEGLLGKRALIPPSRIASSEPLPTDSSSGLPIALLVLGALVLVALAAHERFAGRLWLPRTEGSPA